MKDSLAIILHLYHIDLWQEFKELLIPFRNEFKLYLCLCEDNGEQTEIIKSAKNLFDTDISFHKNYGADIASFLRTLENIKESYFIKIHTKKSLLGQYNQIKWRHILLHDFFSNTNIFESNYKQILTNPDCGMIGNKYLLSTDSENYHSHKIKELCNILKINYDNITNYSFFGGNMFMSKTHLFKKHFLPYQDILQYLLSKELNKVIEKHTGTYSHSLERLFGYIVSLNNLNFYCIKHPTIIIPNNKAPNGKFNLIKLYNNDCYLQEDLNVYGQIIDFNENELSIEWHHMKPKPIQKYTLINKNTAVQKNLDTPREKDIIHE
jgi:lipopolysaccharide biosynthesis protein